MGGTRVCGRARVPMPRSAAAADHARQSVVMSVRRLARISVQLEQPGVTRPPHSISAWHPSFSFSRRETWRN